MANPPPDWEPWHRQRGESDLGYALFQQYLSQELPRNLRGLTRAIPWSSLEELAWEWHWQDRVRLWDRHLDMLRQRTIEDVTKQTAEDVARRHLTALVLMQNLGSAELRKLLQISEQNEAPGVVTARDAVRLVSLGVKLERQVRGETTAKIEDGPDLSGLSVEELRQLRELHDKAGLR